MSTFFANKKDYQNKKWQVVDARQQILGRLAARVSRILTGKERTDYTPHVDTGDGVIIINAKEIMVTGNKAKTKIYKSYSGYPSGQRERTFERVMQEDPCHAVKHAVKGMLPKSRLGKKMITHLLVYPGTDHPHLAQTAKTASPKNKTKDKKK